jgi:hypothetical protein
VSSDENDRMDYTIQVDMEIDDGEWLLGEPMNVTDDRTAAEVADWAADHHTVKDGADWRIRVWPGHDAATDNPPLCELGVCEYEP